MIEIKQVLIPDIGDFKDVPVIEVLVKAGDQVKSEDPLVSLESDKATIEIPAPFAGVIKEVNVKPGDKVSEGALVLSIEITDEAENTVTEAPAALEATEISDEVVVDPKKAVVERIEKALPDSFVSSPKAHAGPSVRRFARELGVNLGLVTGSGLKQRILKEDIQAFVKAELSKSQGNDGLGATLNLLPWPQVDFAKFGPIDIKPLSRIQQITGANLHRNWVMIPHVRSLI